MRRYAGSLRMLGEEPDGERTIGDVLAADAGGGHVISAMWHGIWDGQHRLRPGLGR